MGDRSFHQDRQARLCSNKLRPTECTLGTEGRLSKGMLGKAQRTGLLGGGLGIAKDVGVFSGLGAVRRRGMTGNLRKSFLEGEPTTAGLQV